MPIHEKSLIRPENMKTNDQELIIDGINVAGHWSTFIESRVITDYNENLQDEIEALPGGEFIHRCWQCGSCTNSCTVNAIEPRFNPRYWIYLIRTGMEQELLRDKDIIWMCVSCNKCTYACPRDVVPEGVMKATSHWLEMKGYTPKSPSTIFDEIFSSQVIERGKIEDTEVLTQFLRRTGQPLMQDWLKEIVFKVATKLPVTWGLKSMLAMVFKPKTRDWDRARLAIEEYIHEKEAEHRSALGLNGSHPEHDDHANEWDMRRQEVGSHIDQGDVSVPAGHHDESARSDFARRAGHINPPH
ncbi:MAG: 4Fe-4S dicluster domain-containing protein [Hyphomicrobiaceae bacterium]|nr:4Fe-4S dicluster domain-containing protein [Hyphomicrobiaceae bacterium]